VRAAPAEAEQPGRGPRPELIAAVIYHRATARWRCRFPSFVLADQAGNVQRRLNVRVTPTVGIPPLRGSGLAVARWHGCHGTNAGLIRVGRSPSSATPTPCPGRYLAQGGSSGGRVRFTARIDELPACTRDLEVLRITLVLGQLGCPRGVAYIRLRPAARQRMRTVFDAATTFGGPIMLVRPVLPRRVLAVPRICRSVRIAVRS